MAMAKQRSTNPDNSVSKRNNGRYTTNCAIGGNKGTKSPTTTTPSTTAMDHRRCRTSSGGKGGDFNASPQNQSPRTSPGLVAGHYAACKFSEPPSPKALPPPPQHWTSMSALNSPHHCIPFKNCNNNNGSDIAQQLKVLLKVQA